MKKGLSKVRDIAIGGALAVMFMPLVLIVSAVSALVDDEY